MEWMSRDRIVFAIAVAVGTAAFAALVVISPLAGLFVAVAVAVALPILHRAATDRARIRARDLAHVTPVRSLVEVRARVASERRGV
jgi:hypothetical protein